jgi:hypothetical protein
MIQTHATRDPPDPRRRPDSPCVLSGGPVSLFPVSHLFILFDFYLNSPLIFVEKKTIWVSKFWRFSWQESNGSFVGLAERVFGYEILGIDEIRLIIYGVGL